MLAEQEKIWDAEITEQIPDERIAGRARAGAANAGVVTFHRITDRRTRIMLQLDPQGVVETVGDAHGVVTHRVEGDLLGGPDMTEERPGFAGALRTSGGLGAISGPPCILPKFVSALTERRSESPFLRVP